MAGDESRSDWTAPGSSPNDFDNSENLNAPGDPAASASSGSKQGPSPQAAPTPENQWGSAQTPGWYAQPGSAGGRGSEPGGHFHPFRSYKPGVIPLRALSLTEILDGAFKAIRHNPRVIFGVTLPAAVIAALVQAILMLRMFEMMDYEYLQAYDGELGIFDVFDDSTLLLAGLSVVINLLIIPLVTGVLTISVSRSTMGKKLPLAQTWTMLRGRKAALVGASLLASLITILPFALFFGLLPILDSGGVLVLAVPLLLVGVVAMIFFATRLLFVPQVVVLERQSVWMSFKRGWLLTRGSFWRILGIYLLATLIASVVSSIIATPLSFAAVAFSMLSNVLGASLLAASTMISLLVTVPYSAAVASIIYIDARMRREGLDIELARAAEANA